MNLNLLKELATLKRQTPTQLRERYAEVFGEATRVGNKAWLVKRIAWRLQALAEGDLSERARRRAAELANDADLRLSPPTLKPAAGGAQQRADCTLATGKDERLPPPGSLLTRRYKGQDLLVHVLPKGFEHAGQIYKSLSAVAKAITGTHCNGFQFFGLGQGGAA